MTVCRGSQIMLLLASAITSLGIVAIISPGDHQDQPDPGILTDITTVIARTADHRSGMRAEPAAFEFGYDDIIQPAGADPRNRHWKVGGI